MGCFPIYYRINSLSINHAYQSKELLKKGEEKNLDKEYIVRFLSGGHSPTLSGYRNIFKLPPGCNLSLSDGKPKIERYWQPGSSAFPENIEISDLHAMFNKLLRQTIIPRLERKNRIGVHLTGGLDSTFLALFISELCDELDIPRPLAFTWMSPPNSHTHCHPEQQFVSQLAEQLKLGLHYCPISTDNIHTLLTQDFVGRAYHGTIYHELPVMQKAMKLGVKHLFSGLGGDEGLSYRGNGYHAELLRSGHFIRWLQETSYIPAHIVKSIKQVLFGLDASFRLSNKFKQRGFNTFGNEAPTNGKMNIPKYANTRTLQRQSFLNAGYIQNRIHCHREIAHSFNLEYEFPFLAPDIVDFAISLPRSALLNRQQNRIFLRELLRGKVAEEIRTAPKLKDQIRTNDLLKAFSPLVSKLDKSLSSQVSPERAEFIDWPRLNTAIDEYPLYNSSTLSDKLPENIGKLFKALQFLDNWHVA